MSSKKSKTQDQIQAIKDTFALFDADHNGTVSKDEIGAMMRTLGYLSCSRELDNIISRLDTDGNGYIDYQEFEAFALRINLVSQDSSYDPDFKAAFDMMDKNKDGYIDKSELKYFMSKFGDAQAEEDSIQTIMDADKDGDGKIDYNEYVQHMKGKI